MSTIRYLLLSTSAPALLLACATQHELLRSKPAIALDLPRLDQNSQFSSGAPNATPPSAPKPYTPVRSRTPELYSWQSEKRATCPSEPRAQKAELEPSAARGLFAALPERSSEPERRGQAVSPDFVVAGLRPALHHCFAQWLDERVDAQGSVRFALELGCAGEVEAISAENQGVDEATLGCLFSAVAPARFAPPAGGHATVLVPVVLKNAAR